MGKCVEKRGFTLIELLVVIAIIAILAAILFPVFMSVRDKGRQAQCLSNMKQLGNAFVLYLQDNAETFPPYYNYENGYSETGHFLNDPGDGTLKKYYNWMDSLRRQTSNWGVYRCTSHRLSAGQEWSYTYNRYVGTCPAWMQGPTLNKYALIKRPTKLFLLHHRLGPAWVSSDGMYTRSYIRLYLKGNADAQDYVGKWLLIHNKGTVVTYADGHAAWLTAADESLQDTANYYGTWK